MKAYTDIEQSKRLAEILPTESADMARCGGENVIMTDYMSAKKKFSVCGELTITPCWSLAALLDVLPRVDIEKELWSSDKYDFRVKAYIDDGYAGDWFDNPIDACYEMIIKLYKRKLL